MPVLRSAYAQFSSEMPARLALEEFYKQLKLSQDDDDMLYRKRGLEERDEKTLMLGFVQPADRGVRTVWKSCSRIPGSR